MHGSPRNSCLASCVGNIVNNSCAHRRQLSVYQLPAFEPTSQPRSERAFPIFHKDENQHEQRAVVIQAQPAQFFSEAVLASLVACYTLASTPFERGRTAVEGDRKRSTNLLISATLKSQCQAPSVKRGADCGSPSPVSNLSIVSGNAGRRWLGSCVMICKLPLVVRTHARRHTHTHTHAYIHTYIHTYIHCKQTNQQTNKQTNIRTYNRLMIFLVPWFNT